MDNMENYYFDEDFVDDDDIVDAELEALTEGTDIVLPDDPEERRKLRDELIRNPPPLPAPKGGPEVTERFYGTELNSFKKGRMKIANNLADFIAKTDGVEVYRRADGCPFLRNAVIGLKFENALLRGDAAEAFRSLLKITGDFFFTAQKGKVLFSFSIPDVWDSWREATPEEIEEYENSFEED